MSVDAKSVTTSKKTSDKLALRVHPKDNVGVSLLPISKGTSVMLDDITLTVKEDIPKGHKFALQDIKAAETISKYGFSIGKTTQDILCGEHVHSHNLKTKLVGGETYHYSEEPNAVPAVETDLTFEGYVRENGKVGIRNEVWIINTVGCVNNAAQRIALKCRIKFDGQADDFIANTHPFGCSQLGDDLSNTRNLLASLMQNPNAGGVLVIGLGCENNQLKDMLASAPEINSERVRYFNTQQVGDEVEQGMECIADLLKVMAKDKRQTVPISRLVLGMKCGGSDGFSGLTANPLVGRITDKLTQYGGKVILTETPEMFGAEQILMDRADSKNTFDKIVSLVNNFKQYFINNNQPIYENPSPGNKAGGLTTLEEKSIGAIQKGGSAIISEVIEYGEIISTRPGLTLLQSPGNDAVSSTALAAAGANIVLFTTGRGTPLGFPVPTLKISSNSEIAEFKSHWIDFNAGIIVDSKTSIDECADRLFKQIIAIASGQKTKNEINDNREIAIWKSGVTL